MDSGTEVNLTNVYFPCYNSSIAYSNELSECLSFIEQILDNGVPSVVMGDMNFACNVDNEGYKQCYNVLSRYNVFHCDVFIDAGTSNCVTYYNHSLHHSSFLDHVFVTNTIRKDILYAEVHESGVNLSDHIPIIYTFCWSLKPQGCTTKVHKKVKQYTHGVGTNLM